MHYYDKPKVDHGAIRRLLSAAKVDSLRLVTVEGTVLSLSEYMNRGRDARKIVSEVMDSCGSSLVQVASVFMLAEARAAADAVGTNSGDLETACSALERLLGCVATQKPILPERDIKHSAKVRLGTAARRRALGRLTSSNATNSSHVSILKAVNAVLRLCDVATHCLAVVSRQSLPRKSACEIAVNLSTRLLTLAASLYEVQRTDFAPALSFFSSNSLRTALVTGAMHLGAIIIEHSDIEPMTWIHIADRILLRNSTPTPHRTSLLSALFGGMIRAGKRYQTSDRDTRAAEGAVCLLSTLQVALEADTAEGMRESQRPSQQMEAKTSETRDGKPSAAAPSVNSAPVFQAASSFLGERVISAEEDGDEGRIAARTVYQACEEYAERAGETEGIIDFLAELFASAARQCRQECSEDPVVSISEGTLPCPPDDSDASSEGPQARSDSPQFPIDVFDSRLRDGLGTGPTGGSNSEMSVEQIERIELHREIGALSLECLAHWLDKTQADRRYASFDVTEFGTRICRSSSLFIMSNSSASYDLKSAMVDFGALIGPVLKNRIESLPDEVRQTAWNQMVSNLIDGCYRTNPVLSGIISPSAGDAVLEPLVDAFLSSKEAPEPPDEASTDEVGHLPLESILDLVMSTMRQTNAMMVIEKVSQALRDMSHSGMTASRLIYCTSCLILLSHAMNSIIGLEGPQGHAKLALAALFHRDVDFVLDPALPDEDVETALRQAPCSPQHLNRAQAAILVSSLMDLEDIVGRICSSSAAILRRNPSTLSAKSSELLFEDYTPGLGNTEKLCYHFFWACLMVDDLMKAMKAVSHGGTSASLETGDVLPTLPLSGPYICAKASSSNLLCLRLVNELKSVREGSFAVLFVAECTALLLAQRGNRANQDTLEELLAAIVTNVTDFVSKSFYDDVPKNFMTLYDAFLRDPLQEISIGDCHSSQIRQDVFAKRLTTGVEGSCLLLAMQYMRSVGSGNAQDLLADVLMTTTNLLRRLGHDQLMNAKRWVMEVPKHILFLPASFLRLRDAMYCLLKTYLSLMLKLPVEEKDDNGKLLLFITRVCGYCHLLSSTPNASQDVQAFYKFASDSAVNKDFEVDALRRCMDDSFTYEDERNQVRQFVSNVLPKASLSPVIERILVPRDESAVGVTSHSYSLSLLTKACEASDLWKASVIRSLGHSFTAKDNTIVSHMIQHSVMQSATMSEGIVSVFERVIGCSDAPLASGILIATFTTLKSQLERDIDATLESHLRLINFAVRTAISHGRVSNRIASDSEIDEGNYLGGPLIDLLFAALHRTTNKVLSGTRDKVSEQIILFLCSLIDCVHQSLYDRKGSFFDYVGGPDSQQLLNANQDNTEKGSVEEDSDHSRLQSSSEKKEEPESPSLEHEDSSQSTLCTYTSTGSQFVKQHWYFCYSCELDGSEGVCSVCARICHKDCELAYSKFSRFFCDCGAGSDPRHDANSQAAPSSDDGDGANASASEVHSIQGQMKQRKPCICLQSRREESPSRMSVDNDRQANHSLSSFQNDRDRVLVMELRDLLSNELKDIRTGRHPRQHNQRAVIEGALRGHLSSNRTTHDLTATALFLTKELSGCHTAKETNATWIPMKMLSSEIDCRREASNEGKIVASASIASLAKIMKTSSYEIGGPSSATKQLQGSLIAYSSHECIAAIADKNGCVNFVPSSSLVSRSVISEKKPSSSHRRVRISHSIGDIQFHPGSSNLLLVVGNEKISILCRLSGRDGSFWHNVDVEIGMSEYEGSDGKNELVRASWVSESSTLLLVLTKQFVKVFDVAVDTFCPCFFSKIPGDISNRTQTPGCESSETEVKNDVTLGPVLIGAAVLLEDIHQEGTAGFYIFLLTSFGDFLVCRSKRDDADPPMFSKCFSVHQVCGDVTTAFSIQVVSANHERLVLFITSADGSMVSACIAIREENQELQSAISWVNVYHDAFNPGSNPTELEHISGTDLTFLFFQRGQSLQAAGAITIRQDSCLEVQSFGGTPSATVMGLATFGTLSNVKHNSRGGGFFVLDDGSLHRVDLLQGPRCFPRKLSEAPLSKVMERQRLRAIKSAQRQRDDRHEYDPVPNSIGFFEKCRIVTDHVSIDILDSDMGSGPIEARLSAMISDGSVDSIWSPKPNHPFKFVTRIENNSLVLVGARLLFGQTERSRNRVPGAVKVFNRSVRWKPKNKKRWLDIPFTVTESTDSPQEVMFELAPRKHFDETTATNEDQVGFDCLELYAVSSVEFTERKLHHEKRKAKVLESLKEKQGSSEQRNSRAQLQLNEPGVRTVSSIPKDVRFSEDQAALLAVVSAMGSEKFKSGRQSAELFLELNNQWSIVFDNRLISEHPFLQQIRLVVSALCFEETKGGPGHISDVTDHYGVSLFSRGIHHVIETNDRFFKGSGIPPHILTIEKLLFAVAGLSRALLHTSTKMLPSEKGFWVQIYDNVLPNETHIFRMLEEFLSTGLAGLLLCKSSYSATINAVDIIFVRTVKQNISRGNEEDPSVPGEFFALLVNMLCSQDQDRRLVVGQRVMDFYDSLDDPAELVGSPFELDMATSIYAHITSQRKSEVAETNVSTRVGNPSDASDSTPRWAYRCDICGKVCEREWWHCNDCEDFDLCTTCLRNKSPCENETHKADHILLRGCVDDDLDNQSIPSEGEKGLWEVVVQTQETFGSLVNAVLSHMHNDKEFERAWRYLDAFEVLSQLLGPFSPLMLREPRVKALFRSRFPEAVRIQAKAVRIALESVQLFRHTPSSASVQACNILVLMLRMLLSAPNTSMPAHLHRSNIPAVLFDLLQAMHPKLRALARHISAGNALETSGELRCDLLARSVWNKSLSGLTYTILSTRRPTGHMDSLGDLFETTSRSESCLDAFMSVMVEVLQVLEYSFRNASKASITEQMQNIPRNVLCDIINFCETIGGQVYETSSKRAASAAKRLLTTLSLDDSNTLNHVLDQYLYEEQSSRLSDSLKANADRRNTSYESAVELAGIIKTLHKAARAHSDTWRSFTTAKPDILHMIYRSVKSTEGHVQMLCLQLLASGVASSPKLAAEVIKAQSIENWKPQDAEQKQDKHVVDSKFTSDDRFTDVINGNPQLPIELVEDFKRHPQVSKSIFEDEDFESLSFLVQRVLLRSPLGESRLAAGHFIMFAIVRGASEDVGEFLCRAVERALKAGLDCMPFTGDLADSLMMCLRFMIYCCHCKLFGTRSGNCLENLTTRVASLLRKRCRLLISHPNARLYGRLSEVIDVSGYYLESDPCLTCAAATWESAENQERRLDTIRAETKYTATSIMHRLVSIYQVTSITVKVIEPRRTRRAKKIDVLYSSKAVVDAAELKGYDHPWKKLASLELDSSSTECTCSLTIPVALANIKLAFVEFHEPSELSQPNSSESLEQVASPAIASAGRHGNAPRTTEALHCPRCSRSVTDRHGICRICHENAYQCRQCRNINYENLDGFLCNECGYCKHGRFEFSISGRPTFVAEPIENEHDRKRASKVIEKETSNVHRCIEQLAKFRSSIIRSLTSGIPLDTLKEKGKLLSVNKVGLADLLDMVAPRSEIAVLEAILEGQTGQDIEEATNSTQGGVSVTEEVIAEGNGTIEVGEREQGNRPGSTVASPIHRTGRSDARLKSNQLDSSVISPNTSALAVTYARECRAIFSTMSRSIRVLMLTRAALVSYANTVGGRRRQYETDFPQKFVETDEDMIIHGDGSIPTNGSGNKMSNVNSGCCYGCTQSFVSKAVNLLQTTLKCEGQSQFSFEGADLARDMMLICALCDKQQVRNDIRDLITYLVNDNIQATQVVCSELSKKIGFCIDSYETVDSHSVAKFEVNILEATSVIDDSCWEERLKLVTRILFKASHNALTCSSVSESIILPCLKVAIQLLKADGALTVIRGPCPPETRAQGSKVCKVAGGQSFDAEIIRSERNDHSNTNSNRNGTEVSKQESSAAMTSPEKHSGAEARERSDVLHVSENDHTIVERARRQTHTSSLTGTAVESQDGVAFERKSNPVITSSQLSSSEAPSSIGTAADARVSDDEAPVLLDPDDGINLAAMTKVLESEHDAKRLTANVRHWLDGRQTQSAWMASLTGKLQEAAGRPGSPESRKLSDDIEALRLCFSRWKQAATARNKKGVDEKTSPSDTMSDEERLLIHKENWIIRLMLFTPCADVRKEACGLLHLLCGEEELMKLHLLDLLTGSALKLAAEVGEKSKEFFDLLENALAPKMHRFYVMMRFFLPQLAALIQSRAEQLVRCEAKAEASLQLVNFSEGYSMKRLVSLLKLLLDAIPSQSSFMRQRLLEKDNRALVSSLQRAYICVRKLISMRTRLTDESAEQLSDILLSQDFLFTGPTVSAVVSACVSELKQANQRNDVRSVALLLDELCLMLCPERQEPTCLLVLQKAPTQEEFIRGNMTRNPYVSSSFDGSLMRDVKNKICKDLDLPGLLEDDFAMELLVAGNLVKLDLPIMGVFDHVWRGSTAASMASSIPPSQISRALGLRRGSQGGTSRTNGSGSRLGGLRGSVLSFRRFPPGGDTQETDGRAENRVDPPMIVVYRLSGLDGEATEPIIDSLPKDAGSDTDGEDLYKDTIVFGEVGGLSVLLELLAIVGSWGDDAETAIRAPALRLLRCSCEVARNRAMLSKSPGAVGTLLDCAASAFEHAQGSPTAVSSAESLLIAAERILAQQRKEMDSQMSVTSNAMCLSSHDPDEVMARVKVFLGRLAVATSPTAENSILHLLPFLVQGIPEAIDLVLDDLRFSNDNVDGQEEEQHKVHQLGTVLLATPRDLSGNELAVKTIQSGIFEDAISYVTERFPIPRRENMSVWEVSLKGRAPPLLLRVLAGLSYFLDPSQEQLAAAPLLRTMLEKRSDLIPILCQLEMAVSENAVGTSAEELLDALSRDNAIQKKIQEEREAIKAARREAARASRAAILREVGLAAESERTTVHSQSDDSNPVRNPDDQGEGEDSVLKLMAELPDEIGPACVVCGDGFQCRPEETLGLYVYCRKVSLDISTSFTVPRASPSDRTHGTGRADWEAWSSGRNRESGGHSKSGSSSCFTTVTHMNAIHPSCHKEAARVDRSSRRDEWEGASLRNSQTKCNNLLPLRPPAGLEQQEGDETGSIAKMAKSSYATAVEGYFSRLSSLGRTSLSQSKAIIYDLGRSLLRFADGGTAVFSEHSKGGGPNSNASMIPHLVQLQVYLIESSASSQQDDVFSKNAVLQTQEAALNKYLFENEPGDVTYYLGSSVVLQDLNSWNVSILKFLRRGSIESVVPFQILLRMVAFSDAVHRCLKDGLTMSSAHWLESLRKHIGLDVTFPTMFGDKIDEIWEGYIRSISSTDEFLKAIRKNMEYQSSQSEGSDDLLLKLKELLTQEAETE